MAISSVGSVASTLITSSSNAAEITKQEQAVQQQSKDDAQTKAQKLQEYNQELQKFQAELDQLSKPSNAGATKPTGPTSGLLDESV